MPVTIKNIVGSVYRNITEDIWKSFKDSNFYMDPMQGEIIRQILI